MIYSILPYFHTSILPYILSSNVIITEPGGFLPREALKLVGLVAKEGLCGMEIVEVSPPYDHADITSLMALRIIVDALGSMVSHGKLGKHKDIIDKPFVPF
jgi:agmatinase